MQNAIAEPIIYICANTRARVETGVLVTLSYNRA